MYYARYLTGNRNICEVSLFMRCHMEENSFVGLFVLDGGPRTSTSPCFGSQLLHSAMRTRSSTALVRDRGNSCHKGRALDVCSPVWARHAEALAWMTRASKLLGLFEIL